MTEKAKKIIRILWFDLVGSVALGCSVVCFAVQANFSPGGVTGLAVLINYLTKAPIGLVTLLLNVPIIALTFKRLGKEFFLISMKSIFISNLFIDFVVIYLPCFTGSRLAAALLAGIFAGVAYSFFFNEGSSTGGTDFIIVAMQKVKPRLSFGILAFVIDSSVILLSVFVYRELWAFVYGMIYTVVTSLALDGTTWLLKKLHWAAK